MITSFFMTIGSMMVPIGFLLILASYEFDKPAVWYWAFFAFIIGFGALGYSFFRAFKDETDRKLEKEKSENKNHEQHIEMMKILKDMNEKLGKIVESNRQKG